MPFFVVGQKGEKMFITVEEQETVVQFNRAEKYATIYTSDKTMMTKLDKLVENSEYYELKREEHAEDGTIVAKEYRLNEKSLVSFRSTKSNRTMTDEQKAKAAERMRNLRK